MKFTITKEKLEEALSAVGPSVATKTNLPILANILCETTETGVRFSGTDLNMGVSYEVPADVEQPGALTIPGKKFIDVVKYLEVAPVRIEVTGERLRIKCGKYDGKILGLPRDDFPAFPAIPFHEGWEMSGAALRDLVGSTAFAVSSEESRPVLNGVCWRWSADGMEMAATNGHRLARRRLTVLAPNSGEMIVPPAALERVVKHVGNDTIVRVASAGNYVGFQREGLLVYTRLIEGPYPNYDQVIPKDNDKTATFERGVLVNSLRRMDVLASDQTHRIRIALTEGAQVQFGVETPDMGEATDECHAGYSGEPIEIGFNAGYLLSLLSQVHSEQVRLTFKSPERAATIEAVRPDGTVDPSLLYVCMPLRLGA